MNEYLQALEHALGRMSAGEKAEIASDFREHFLAGRAAGKTDAEIAAGLGDPVQVGRMYRAENAVAGLQTANRPQNVLRMLGAVLRYKLLGGLGIACLYAAALILALTLFVLALSILALGAASLAYGIMVLTKGYALYALLGAFLTLSFVSLGLLGFRGSTAFWRATLGQMPRAARRLMRIRGSEV